mmetsp:Transcript_17597/g.36726  ORF Transcript_17597/g.36726 Transcript_17597/m.36726 type:complete len:81 (+) Transcript_17597:121-363(+)
MTIRHRSHSNLYWNHSHKHNYNTGTTPARPAREDNLVRRSSAAKAIAHGEEPLTRDTQPNWDTEAETDWDTKRESNQDTN